MGTYKWLPVRDKQYVRPDEKCTSSNHVPSDAKRSTSLIGCLSKLWDWSKCHMGRVQILGIAYNMSEVNPRNVLSREYWNHCWYQMSSQEKQDVSRPSAVCHHDVTPPLWSHKYNAKKQRHSMIICSRNYSKDTWKQACLATGGYNIPKVRSIVKIRT